MNRDAGRQVRYRFDGGGLSIEEIAQAAADIWSDLAFDLETRAKLRRDGLAIDGLRLTGPTPFLLTLCADGQIEVIVAEDPLAETLIDLWRVHIMRGLRLRPLAA